MPIKDIRERLFQYRGKNRDFSEAIKIFKQQKESLIKHFVEFEYLDNANRTDLISYLESFYKIIEDPALVQEKLITKS